MAEVEPIPLSVKGVSAFNPNKRRMHKRGAGFLMAADVGHRVIDSAARVRVPKLIAPGSEYPHEFNTYEYRVGTELDAYEPRPGIAGVAYLTRSLSHAVREHIHPSSSKRTFDRRFDVLPEDRENGRFFEFEDGLADQDFTWHFAPAVAVDVIEHFKYAGLITQEQQDNLSLGDYADMLGSMWFSELMHDLALTSNGEYGNHGLEFSQYGYGKLRERMLTGEDIELFALSEQTDDLDGRTYYTASLTKEFRKVLRERMKDRFSIGCPVARRAGTLALDLVNNDEHAKRLIRDRHMTVAEMPEAGKARFTYEYTAIDHALDALALQFDDYDQRFGTPLLWRQAGGTIHVGHEERPKTYALSYVRDQEQA